MEVRIESNVKLFLDALPPNIEKALEAMGIQAESHAKRNIQAAGRIDKGASGLWGSIAHQVDISEKAVYIGSDLEYAIYNEVGTGIYAEGGGGRKTPWRYQDDKGNWHTTIGMKPIHFLKKAIEEHKEEYAKIAEEALKS